MRYYECLILTLVLCCVIFQDVSGIARVTRSNDENLRDIGTYIVHFEDSITDAQLQHFTKQLLRRTSRKVKFEAEIISEYPSIKCLTARLSKRALKWVSYSLYHCYYLLNLTFQLHISTLSSLLTFVPACRLHIINWL